LQTSSEKPVETFSFEYRPAALDQLESAMLVAFEGGAPRVILDLDHLETLDSAGVRGLIVLLRRSREMGGVLALHATKPDICRTLQTMALDRLFPMTVEAA
jgi:anti-anti-sigma factor